MPVVRIFCHYKIQQTSSIGYGTALRIHHTGHLPTYIYCCNIGADEADFDVGIRLMAVSENCREHRSMKLFNLGSSGRTHAAHICEIGVLGENHCERVSIVPVPRIHEMVHQSPNRFLINFAEHVSSRCGYILTSYYLPHEYSFKCDQTFEREALRQTEHLFNSLLHRAFSE